MSAIVIFAAVLALLAAVGFFLSARGARVRAAESAAELANWRAEAEKASKELADQKGELKRLREETQTLRADLAAAKKKTFDAKEQQRALGGSAALREELEKLATRLDQQKAETQHALDEKGALAKELERLKKAVEAKPAEAPKAAEHPNDDKVKELQEKLAAAEAKQAEVRKAATELANEVKKLRGRLETEKRVYTVQKGELELAADRYAEQKRRYERLRRDHEELIQAVRQAAAEERGGAGLGPATGEARERGASEKLAELEDQAKKKIEENAAADAAQDAAEQRAQPEEKPDREANA